MYTSDRGFPICMMPHGYISNDKYKKVVEWDEEEDNNNENNKIIYKWIEVMKIIKDLVIMNGNNWMSKLG